MAKISFTCALGHSFFCTGVFSIGVYIKDDKAVLFDSGISKEGAKELNKALLEAHLHPVALINTHCHGDHSGGNAFFQEKYPELKIFSTETEKPFIEDPHLAPICFCGGAAAFEELKRCKPITPQQKSTVTHLIAPYQDQKISLLGETFEIITVPGHTRGMIAIRTPDNVLYCGDALFGEETFQKHPILFYTFIGETLKTFQKLKALIPSVAVTILYHGGRVENIQSLIEDHERRILETQDLILLMLQKQPHSLEEMTAQVMQLYGISDDIVSYTLTKTPLQAYISQLESENRVEMRVTKGNSRAHSIEEKASTHAPHPQSVLL